MQSPEKKSEKIVDNNLSNVITLTEEEDDIERTSTLRDYDSVCPDRSSWYTFLATICMGGIQFLWTVQLARGTSYLSRLNLPDKITALVWLSGPLSGLIMQPLAGALSDKCDSNLGKRRPFIIVASFFVCLSMLGISFSKEIGGDGGNHANLVNIPNDKMIYKPGTLVVAILSFYLLNFSLNAVTACCRSLIIEVHPLHQQNRANAFANNAITFVNVLGHGIGSLNLVPYFPRIISKDDESGQLKILCFISMIFYCATMTVTCVCIKEERGSKRRSEVSLIVYFWRMLKGLPKSFQRLYLVQVFISMALFEFYFCASAWVIALNNLEFEKSGQVLTTTELDSSDRMGSISLLINSGSAVIFSVLLPLCMRWISMKTMFILCNIVLSIAYFCTHVVSSAKGAFVIMSILGLPIGCVSWIIFTYIGKFIQIEKEKENSTVEAGIAVGINNMAVSAPHLFVALLSSLIFRAVHQQESNDIQARIYGYLWLFKLGGVASFIGTVCTFFIVSV